MLHCFLLLSNLLCFIFQLKKILLLFFTIFKKLDPDLRLKSSWIQFRIEKNCSIGYELQSPWSRSKYLSIYLDLGTGTGPIIIGNSKFLKIKNMKPDPDVNKIVIIWLLLAVRNKIRWDPNNSLHQSWADANVFAFLCLRASDAKVFWWHHARRRDSPQKDAIAKDATCHGHKFSRI